TALRRRRRTGLRRWLGAAGDDEQGSCPVRGRNGVDAAMGPVAHVAGGDGPELVAEGALDDEDQLVADVAMARKLGTRLNTIYERPTLGGSLPPPALPLHSRLAIFPVQNANSDAQQT